MRKLLAVMPESTNYGSCYDVTFARSFEHAKEMIESEEKKGMPYDDLDLPVSNEKSFQEFIDWLEKTNRKRYAFSIFGQKDDRRFFEIAREVRERGFYFIS